MWEWYQLQLKNCELNPLHPDRVSDPSRIKLYTLSMPSRPQPWAYLLTYDMSVLDITEPHVRKDLGSAVEITPEQLHALADQYPNPFVRNRPAPPARRAGE